MRVDGERGNGGVTNALNEAEHECDVESGYPCGGRTGETEEDETRYEHRSLAEPVRQYPETGINMIDGTVYAVMSWPTSALETPSGPVSVDTEGAHQEDAGDADHRRDHDGVKFTVGHEIALLAEQSPEVRPHGTLP